ncbi:hypothetical protein HYH03_014676 [Edaphochlamys debaryana]|uniref:Uncharacterized protein n=1 Tax=Edaphochlamys debaryana TaxID=47281 RepID=A0A835XVJ3_9CHLO|nr:hypothetical protein HYH03_014676 [Edaphochlamys debaryana]|eukprot:KAG2486619.1 hypothetical protein HYH03_014676 [Edaphochlamys debaryana]
MFCSTYPREAAEPLLDAAAAAILCSLARPSAPTAGAAQKRSSYTGDSCPEAARGPVCIIRRRSDEPNKPGNSGPVSSGLRSAMAAPSATCLTTSSAPSAPAGTSAPPSPVPTRNFATAVGPPRFDRLSCSDSNGRSGPLGQSATTPASAAPTSTPAPVTTTGPSRHASRDVDQPRGVGAAAGTCEGLGKRRLSEVAATPAADPEGIEALAGSLLVGLDLTGRTGELVGRGRELSKKLAEVQARKQSLVRLEEALAAQMAEVRAELLSALQTQWREQGLASQQDASPAHTQTRTPGAPAVRSAAAPAPAQPRPSQPECLARVSAGAAPLPSALPLPLQVARPAQRPAPPPEPKEEALPIIWRSASSKKHEPAEAQLRMHTPRPAAPVQAAAASPPPPPPPPPQPSVQELLRRLYAAVEQTSAGAAASEPAAAAAATRQPLAAAAVAAPVSAAMPPPKRQRLADLSELHGVPAGMRLVQLAPSAAGQQQRSPRAPAAAVDLAAYNHRGLAI